MRACVLAAVIVACGPSLPSAADEAAVLKDAADQKACIDGNATRSAIDACRDAVKARRK